MRGESMKDKSKKSTYSTTFGVDPEYLSGITPKHVATLSVKPIFKDSHDEWYVSKELMEWLLMHPSESHSIYFGQLA